jgi:hypothetical protein
LLNASLSPCRRYHPAGVNRRLSQAATPHAAFTLHLWARPPGLLSFGATRAFTSVAARRLAHHPEDGFVDGLQVIRFPSCLPSKLRGLWLLPRRD